MLEISIIICIITLMVLKICLNIKFKDIKALKNRTDVELEKLSNKFPADEKICTDILSKFNNNVKIEIQPEYNSCLYTIFNKKITIGKFQQNYMKIQTIAHECIHSNQNKIILWSNFIFTNIYLIYFFIISILGVLNKLQYSNIHIIILIFFSFIQCAIRNYLENDAMIRAPHVAKEYIEENNILEKEETAKLLKEYEEVNEIVIPFMNYYTIGISIIKIIIFSLIVLI